MDIFDTIEHDIPAIRLVGRLDGITSTALQETLTQYVQNSPSNLILNLSELEYVSSAGLRVFLLVQKNLKKQNSEMQFVGLQPIVKEVFALSGFLKLFQHFDTLEDALDVH